MKANWNDLSFEAWSALSKKNWEEFVSGNSTVTLPESFYTINTDYGTFIQVQPLAFLDEEPLVFVRTSYYGPALKVQIPNTAKAGDKIRVKRKSKSGKSLIAEVVREG